MVEFGTLMSSSSSTRLTETADRMGRLHNKKSPHPWWAVALALTAVLESGNEDAISIAHKTFEEAMNDQS